MTEVGRINRRKFDLQRPSVLILLITIEPLGAGDGKRNRQTFAAQCCYRIRGYVGALVRVEPADKQHAKEPRLSRRLRRPELFTINTAVHDFDFARCDLMRLSRPVCNVPAAR
jgi:hypothetical protein